MKKIYLILTLIFLGIISQAQEINNLRYKKLIVYSDSVELDTLTLIPGSIEIFSKGKIIPKDIYSFDYKNSIVIFKESLNDSVLIKYRVFPENFDKKHLHKKNIDIDEISEKNDINKFENNERSQDLFNDSELTKSGSISRGITVGNNQNASLNSDMNIQVSGKLSPEVSILAAISDNNIPLQADGSTQNLREFDKIFIKVFSEKTSLILGDYKIIKPEGYFLNSSMNVQGTSFETELLNKKDKKLNSKIIAAVSKGKYNKLNITGIEGNQGPYRLVGTSGETYILVLSGSERIYIDGELLERGADNDYVIDYNSAELIFTAKRIITKDSRIIAEFEYSEMSYTRYISGAFNNYTFDKGNIYINILSEFDAKNQPVTEDLSDAQKEVLNNSGDNLSGAYVENIIVSDRFVTGMTYYRRADTLIDNVLYSNIYVYVPESYQGEKLIVGYSEMGEGKGNYIKKISPINGKIFEWVAPVNGIMQGEYEPVKLLTAPQKKKMISMGGNYQTNRGELHFESAYSNNDKNLFSLINDNDNEGYSFKSGFKQWIVKNDSTGFNLDLCGDINFTNKDFTIFEPFRKPEFARDWNLDVEKFANDEFSVNTGLEFFLGESIKASYFFEKFEQRDFFSGNRNIFKTDISKKFFLFNASFDEMKSVDTANYTDFIKYDFLYKIKLKSFFIGVKNSGERNLFSEDDKFEKISDKAYKFNKFEPFAGYNFKNGNTILLQYILREDFSSNNDELKYFSKASDYKGVFNFKSNPKNLYTISLIYRELKYSVFADKANDETFLGRISHNITAFNGSISNSIFLNLGSGREVAKEYTFIEVQPGNGVFAWKDFNENGLKELNEFVKSEFPDEAKYIKIALLSNEYIDVLNADFSETMNIRLNKIFTGKSIINQALSMVSNITAFSISKKTSADGLDYLQIFIDSLTSSEKKIFRNTVSFSPRNRNFVIEYNIRHNSNKILLTNGIDSRKIDFNSFSVLKRIKKIKFFSEYKTGKSSYVSEFFGENNYEIKFSEIKFNTVITVNKSSMVFMNFRESDKKNNFGIEKLKLFETETGINYGFLEKGNLEFLLKYVNIFFDGNTNTSVAYDMLEALNRGDNFIWEINLGKKIFGGIQFNLNYFGRKSNDNKIIHNGGVSLRAVF